MGFRYDDDKIENLLKEKKLIQEFSFKDMRSKKGHMRKEITIVKGDGSCFQIKIRQNTINPLDFSIILGYISKDSNGVFRLMRCNGRAHEHSNKIEKETFFGFHVHKATKRYQEKGFKEDTYAIECTDYADLTSAWSYFCKTANIGVQSEQAPDKNQMTFFNEEE